MAKKYYVIHSEQIPAASDYDIATNLVEIAMRSDATVSDLPTSVAPNSMAFQADGEKIKAYIFTADGEWTVFTV